MKFHKEETRDRTNALHRAAIHGTQRRTLEAIFRRPAASAVAWTDVAELVGKIGSLHETGGGGFDLHVGGKHHLMHKPHTRGLTGSEVIDLRHFLQEAGWSPDAPSEADATPDQVPPTLMVVVDHHGARIYRIETAASDASQREIRRYDPHGLLHRLAHKEPADDARAHVSEAIAFYERIADAAAAGGKIIVVAHGAVGSKAAQHLTEYLRAHHRETYQRVVSQLTTDLTGITEPQLLAIAEEALGPAS